MSKKAYVGINGISKNVKNIYVGVNGVPKKVVKGYVGVNGVARLFWDGGGSSVIPSWDSWSSKAGNTNNPDITIASTRFYKRNNKIAYFAMAVLINERWIEQRQFTSHAIYISPDADATAFDYYASGTTHYTAQTSVVDKNNMLWYICYFPQALQFSIPAIRPAECVLNTTDNPYYYDTTYDPETPSHNKKPMVDAIKEAALDLIDRIYSVPFHEDYQIGTRYKLGITDVRKTIRKVISTALYSGVLTKASDPAYIAFSDNADAIISNLMSVATSHIMELQVQAYSNIVNIYLFSTSMLETPYVQIDTDRGGGIITQNGYTYMLFSDDWQAGGLYPDFEYDVTVDENGNISYEYVDPFRDVDYRVGMHLDPSNNLIDTEMTNMGIDL